MNVKTTVRARSISLPYSERKEDYVLATLEVEVDDDYFEDFPDRSEGILAFAREILAEQDLLPFAVKSSALTY